MQKRAIIISFVLIILTILLFMGCLPSKPSTPTVEYISKGTFQEAVDSINSKINNLDQNKANDSSLKSLRDDIDARFRNISGANSYDKSQTYSKSEVDAAIAGAIKDLKNGDQSWIKKSSGGGSSNPTSDTGSVTFAVTPAAIPQMYSASTGGGQTVFYTMKIINGTTTWQYVKPIVNMSIQSSYSSRAVTGITITMSCGSCSLTGARTSSDVATSSIGNFSISPNVGSGATATSSVTIIPISGCNGTGEFQLGSGQSMDILIQISNLTTSDVTLWNISNSISSRSL